MSESVWPMLKAERQSLGEYLKTLSPTDWQKPSDCAGWTVHDTVCHLVAGAKSIPPIFMGRLIAAGFNFDKMIAKDLKREASKSGAELIAEWGPLVSRKTFPGRAMLGETIVHREDIRRGVGSPASSYDTAHLIFLADSYKNAGPPLKVKTRIAGLKLKATDADWSTGEGPEMNGPLVSLILAMTGRQSAINECSGPGRDALLARL